MGGRCTGGAIIPVFFVEVDEAARPSISGCLWGELPELGLAGTPFPSRSSVLTQPYEELTRVWVKGAANQFTLLV